jgi:MFS family permease
MREIKINVTLEEKANSSGWAAFFKTVGNRRRFFIIIMMGSASQWLGNGLVSYFLVPILNEVGIKESSQLAGINGGLAIWSWFAAMTGAGLCERFGRRPLFLVSLAGCFISFIFITALSGSFATTQKPSVGVAMIPFLFLFNSSHSLAFTPLPMLYTPEIAPFALRAKSAALLLLSQNLAQTFNQFANPVALAAIAWKYYIVYVAVIATYFTLFFFFIRETKGLTVEEAAVVYEPEDSKQAVQEQERQMAAEVETYGEYETEHEVREVKAKDDDASSHRGLSKA